MKSMLFVLAAAQLSATAFANPSLVPGSYSNDEGCLIVAEGNVRPGVLKIDIYTQATGGSQGIIQGAPVLDYAKNKALDFSLCTEPGINEAVALSQSTDDAGNAMYRASCGNDLARVQTNLAVVANAAGEIVSVTYSDKVAKGTAGGFYLPGTQSVTAQAQCGSLKKQSN